MNSPVRYFEPYPVFVARADKSSIWDADGRRYADFCNGYGSLLLGHRRREVVSAAAAQLSRGTLYCAPTEAEIRLAQLVRRNFPSMERVRLVNTGSEATMTAVRLARGHTKRRKIVMFDGCYHGAHDSVLVRAGSGSAHRGISVSEGGLDAVSRSTLVAGYNDLEGFERVVARNAGDVAGVIVEPVAANMGLVPPEPGFLRGIRRETARHGIVLIFDEVVTGFRASPGGAQALFGIRPDITTLAKALGNGFAIAAVGGSKGIMDLLPPAGRVYQASTFAGNPVAVAAAAASVRTMNRLAARMYPRLERGCRRLAAGVRDAASELGVRCSVNSISSMMQIFFTGGPVTDRASAGASDAGKFRTLFRSLLRSGVFVPPSQFETVFLSNAHTGEDLELAAGAYRDALAAVRRG